MQLINTSTLSDNQIQQIDVVEPRVPKKSNESLFDLIG
jgi:hypothetical protein